MKYKVNLLTIQIYSENGSSNYVDEISRNFVSYLVEKYERDFKILCNSNRSLCLADLEKSNLDLEEYLFNDSEYAIIITSTQTQSEFQKISEKLTSYLTSKSIWKNRFVIVVLENVDVNSTLFIHPIINFTFKDPEYRDDAMCLKLLDLIKEPWIPYKDDNTEEKEDSGLNKDNDNYQDDTQKTDNGESIEVFDNNSISGKVTVEQNGSSLSLETSSNSVDSISNETNEENCPIGTVVDNKNNMEEPSDNICNSENNGDGLIERNANHETMAKNNENEDNAATDGDYGSDESSSGLGSHDDTNNDGIMDGKRGDDMEPNEDNENENEKLVSEISENDNENKVKICKTAQDNKEVNDRRYSVSNVREIIGDDSCGKSVSQQNKANKGFFSCVKLLPTYLFLRLLHWTVCFVLRFLPKRTLMKSSGQRNASRKRRSIAPMNTSEQQRYSLVKLIRYLPDTITEKLKDIVTGLVQSSRDIICRFITYVLVRPLAYVELQTREFIDAILFDPTNHRLGLFIDLLKDEPSPLTNTKETCYMNSMVQALASSTRLIGQLTAVEQSIPYNNKLNMFIKLLNDINRSSRKVRYSSRATADLISFMNTIHWDRTSQQDAFQLLSFCINAIHKEIQIEQCMPPKFEILHIFSENYSFNKIQDHLALSVPLRGSFAEKPGAKLDSLLDSFFESSDIDSGEHTTTMYLFDTAPDVMILHIQANEWDHQLNKYIKPKYFIEYKERLKYAFPVIKESTESKAETIEVVYQLSAVVEHMGSVSGGHYITYRKHKQQWYLTNDQQVEKICFQCDIVPYIMVYEKIN